MNKLYLSLIATITLTACSTQTYVSEENVDKYGSPEVVKFQVEPCIEVAPQTIVAAVEHFDFDKAELSPSDHKSLNSLIEQIQDLRGEIFIMAHTDEQGTDQYNETLALNRAKAVQQYIQERVTAQNYQWELKAFGERDPLIAEHNLEAFEQNRRVLVVFESKETTQPPTCSATN